MRNFSILAAIVCVAMVCSCSRARVNGLAPDAAGNQLLVKVLGAGGYDRIDTVKVKGDGRFSFSLDIEKDQPRFVYVSYKDRNVASLLLERGDCVRIKTDTLGGNCTVSGSAESEKLMENEKEYALFLRDIGESESTGEFVSKYVAWYRKCVAYLIENCKSLTAIPVIHEKINEYSPVFAQTTDAIHFRALCDSLKTVYPESIYVKSLESETAAKERAMALESAIRNAPKTDFPDIELPGIDGRMTRLSSVKSKVVLLHFWNSADPYQKIMNLEVLKPVYDDYHRKGFEIFAVDINPDKVVWGNVVNAQKLGWINVNDGRGLSCPALLTYNVTKLPESVILTGGSVISGKIYGEAGLRKELSRLLK